MAENAVEGFLHGKTASVPNAVWVVVVGSAVGYAIYRRRKGASATPAQDAGTASDGSTSLAGQAPAQFLPISAPTPTSSGGQTFLSNGDWIRAALVWTAANPGTAGMNVVSATQALNDYLNGTTLSDAEQKYLQIIFNNVGAPPSPPSGGTPTGNGGQTYADNNAWAEAAITWGNANGHFRGVKLTNLVYSYLKGGPIWSDEYDEINAIQTAIGPPPQFPGIPIIWPVNQPQSAPVTGTPPPKAVPLPLSNKPQPYTVQRGDTLSSIAAKFHTTWQAIYNANRNTIKNPNLIYPQQKLTIP